MDLLSTIKGLSTVSTGSSSYPDRNFQVTHFFRYFTLPQLVIPTLEHLGLTTFRDAIAREGLVSKLSDTPGVTIFAFKSNSSDAILVAEHTITNQVAYTQELLDYKTFTADSGTTLTITMVGGFTFVNGVRIIKSDIIIKNGVVHQLERVIFVPRFLIYI